MSKKVFKRLMIQKHRELMQEMARTHKYYTDSTSAAKKKDLKDKSQDSNETKGKQAKPGKSSKNKRNQAKHPTRKRNQ